MFFTMGTSHAAWTFLFEGQTTPRRDLAEKNQVGFSGLFLG
jgi:hypothetical protein